MIIEFPHPAEPDRPGENRSSCGTPQVRCETQGSPPDVTLRGVTPWPERAALAVVLVASIGLWALIWLVVASAVVAFNSVPH